MTAAWLMRRHARQRRAAMLALAVIVALGATATFVAAGAADRTGGAYARYLDRADVSDVVINPSLSTTEIDRVIRDLPGVRAVTTDALFLGTLNDDGHPRPRSEFDELIDALQVRGSADGRYLAMDRPALAEGRLPSGSREALVGVGTAEAHGIAVGDVVPVAFWSPSDEMLAAPDQVITPLGVERLRVVGIATLPDEVLPDELYPRERMIVSADVAARYDCIVDLPPVDAPFEEALLQLVPPGCGTSYRYYALDLDGGAAAVSRALDAFLAQTGTLNEGIPPSISSEGAGYYLIATTTADERERVERSIQPAVTALGVLAAAVGAVTLVVLALAVARELRQTDADRATWWRLGLSRRDHVVALGVPMLVAIAAGLVAAVGAAWWLSPIAPVGSVRSVEPSPGRELSPLVAAVGAGVAVLAAAIVVVLCSRAARRVARPPVADREAAGQRAAQRVVPVAGRPDVAEGVRAALGGSRGAGLVVASSAMAVGVFLAAVVFGASLARLLSTPESYGWPWDVAAMTGSGYGDLDLAAVEETLDGRADVANWTALGLLSDVTIDDHPVQAVLGWEEREGVDFTVVEGRLPRAGDEVALGARTAAERGVGVGEEVDLDGPTLGPRRVTVTGIAVIPPLGQFQADRAGPGNGMVLPREALGSEEEALDLLTFVGVDLTAGADAAAVHADMADDVRRWDTLGAVPFDYAEPVRPAEVVNVRSMRSVPLLVGALLAASAAVGLTVAVLTSVRARRRDLAVLRALGFTGRQVRRAVRAQVVTTMLAALVVGVPLGVATGRVVWRAFASQLGVATAPAMPGAAIAVTVMGALVLAVVVAAVPARAAARIMPADALRTE